MKLVHVLRLALFATIVFMGIVVWANHGLDGIIPSNCTVGLEGHAVSMTAEGFGAGPWCDGTVAQSPGWYRYIGDTQPSGAVICQFVRGSVSVTVRDQGIMNADGTELCNEMIGGTVLKIFTPAPP
ncbi:MAG: hypothetical protein ACRDGQ_02680 [Candidatus Limnocylindrales bacterium]